MSIRKGGIMEFIKAVTFGFMSKRGEWEDAEAFDSLRQLKERYEKISKFPWTNMIYRFVGIHIFF